jgi:hypothetical protein
MASGAAAQRRPWRLRGNNQRSPSGCRARYARNARLQSIPNFLQCARYGPTPMNSSLQLRQMVKRVQVSRLRFSWPGLGAAQ